MGYQDLTKSVTKFKDLVQIEFNSPAKKLKRGLGCETCPRNKAKGVNKIKGFKEVKSRSIFLWFQNPGRQENEQRKALVGPAGQMLWRELKAVGIDRSDCDIQNVMRCWANEWSEEEERFVDRAPTNEEIKHCSVHTQHALELNAGKAKVHMVFGQIAAKALLGREYKKDTPIFWSEKLQAKVVCLDHTSYFLHGAPEHRLQLFRERLRLAIGSLQHSGKYSYLRSLDYKLIFKPAKLREYLAYVKEYCLEHKKAVTVDIEDGYTYKGWSSKKLRRKEVWRETPGAERSMLIVGFCHAPKRARAVVVDHPDNPQSIKVRNEVKTILKSFLEDPEVEKVMHYGSSDLTSLREVLGIRVKNYWYDTNYGAYLLWPELKRYGLDNLSKQKLPEFAGYKEIIQDYVVKGKANYATIPLKIMRLYNCGDSDVTKRIEVLTRKPLLTRDPHSKPLLKTYRHVAFTLRDITPRGPFFDRRYAKDLQSSVRLKLRYELKCLRRISKHKDLNPRSHPQIKKIIYGDFKLPLVTVKRKEGRTDEGTLLVLKSKTNHPFIDHLLQYRGLSVMDHTQLKGYELSADTYEERLRTIWWLTGAITGRLRSGGRKDEPGVVNLQNVPKAPVIKNVLVSDLLWRKVIKWRKQSIEASIVKILKRKVFMIADYSAIELRVIGEIGEPKFIPIFKSGKDIHGQMGAGFTDWSYTDICTDEEIRVKVKNINFGLPYGTGKQSFFEMLIARGTKITRKESDALHDAYFAEYDGVVRLQRESAQMAEDTGYAKTLFGFWRPIVSTGDDTRHSFWKNQAINSRVQGTAHQYLLMAMALLHTHKNTFKYLGELSMEIHDALCFFSRVKHMQKTYKQVRQLLTEAVPEYVKKHFNYTLKIPLECEVKAGFRLGTVIKYKGEDPMEFVDSWIKANRISNLKIEEEWDLLEAA